MSDVYGYDDFFRRKIAALCLQPAWFVRYGTFLIKPEYFQTQEERDVVAAILEFYDRYRKLPADYSDIVTLCGGSHKEYAASLFEPYDFSLVKDEVIHWAKEQAAKNAVLDSVEDVKRGNLEAVKQRIEEASRVGEDLTNLGIDLVADTSLWLSEEVFLDKVPTGLLHIDIHLDGGIGRGELLVVLAPSNRGKSMGLVNLAYGAAGLGSGLNVVIFTHEMRALSYAKRFGARMLHKFPTRATGLTQYEAEFLHAAKMLMPGKVRIIGDGKMSTGQIEGHLDRLLAEGFEPDLVLDDYADLIIPPRRHTDRRFELTETYEWLRDLGTPGRVTERGFASATASQTNRGAYNKEVITEQDIAEDIGKVNTADIVMAICQTQEEATAERCRLYGVKVRDGQRGFMFDAKFLTASQAIITIGPAQERSSGSHKEM